MDFTSAAQRLARDQSKAKAGRRPVQTSALAKSEADRRRQLDAERAALKRNLEKQRNCAQQYMDNCERRLRWKPLSLLRATSIYGDGDKITLPPSFLERFTSDSEDGFAPAEGSPWTFRVGLLNPNYTFPMSPILLARSVPKEGLNNDDNSQSSDDDDDDSSHDDDNDRNATVAYLDELSYKYLAYTHAAVLEFTQDEGCVGLSEPIAAALIQSAQQHVQSTLTAAAASAATAVAVVAIQRTVDPAKEDKDDTDTQQFMSDVDDDQKTPGHMAWGAFDLPADLVEVSLVQLPKGKACTLIPTEQAIHNGFYNLQDIKMVLEQSLARTRATLSVKDAVSTWHRGTRFDLTVSSVRPSTWQGILCVNTDIEVEFGEKNATEPNGNNTTTRMNETLGRSPNTQNETASTATAVKVVSTALELRPEPPLDQTKGVCTVQIRADGVHSKRRFDVSVASANDLYSFAATLRANDSTNFQLVTRYPRRVLDRTDKTLQEANVMAGQELFLLERL
jgi:hypothetical protein